MTTPSGASAATGRPGSLLLLAGALAFALVAGVAAVAWTGAAAPSLLFDPGPWVRWGLPVATVVARAAAAVTVGVLALTAVALPVQPPGDGARPRSRAFAPGLRLAAWAAGIWGLATLAQAVLQYAQVSGTPLADPAFGAQLGAYLTGTEPGQGLATTLAVALLVSLLATGAATIGTAGFLFLLSLVGLIPPSLAGHAAGTSDHETAVTGLGLHLLGVCLWVGGLTGLVLLRDRLGSALPAATRRYSTVAAWSFAVVLVSGLVNAVIRVPQWSGLATEYGLLLMAKTLALLGLAVAGMAHRQWSLPRVDAGAPGAFTRLAVAEVLTMAATLGLAVALAASAPPPSGARAEPTLAESVTGYPLPDAPTASSWLTAWQPDLLWVVLTGLALGLYGVGVIRLHRRGDSWPVLRTVSWSVGVFFLIYVTCGPPMTYGRFLFSAHMIGHMALSMLVPIFLVLGAPITLALRAVSPRGDGSRGPREWLVAVTESGYARVLSFPPMAAFLFAGSLVFFYFSPLFGVALHTHVGHELMHVHFLFAGYVFAWVLVGADPGPRRPSAPLRLVTLLATMAFHAFFGVALLSMTQVLQPDYFGGLGRTWGADLLTDQRLGGGIAWGIGDLPAIALALVIAVQWARADDREARRRDRAADRDGEAELAAYNAMLSGIAQTDQARKAAEDQAR